MAREFTIFISHSWKYPDDLKNLRKLLEQRGYFNFKFREATQDDPIDSENAPYIKSVLKRRIQSSDIVLGIAGMYASYSEWMEWELDKAIELDIPIIGVIPWGQERVSKTVSDRSIIDVRWNTESIVDAIRSYAK